MKSLPLLAKVMHSQIDFIDKLKSPSFEKSHPPLLKRIIGQNIPVPSTSSLSLCSPYAVPGHPERVGRTLAHYFIKVSDLWTEMDASTLRKQAPLWCGTVSGLSHCLLSPLCKVTCVSLWLSCPFQLRLYVLCKPSCG